MERTNTSRSSGREDEDGLAAVTSVEFMRRHSGESYYGYKSNAIWIGRNIPDDLLNSVVAHELNHFLVHVSTPYGWFLDECQVLENNLILSYCLDHEKRYPGSRIEVPLYDVAKLSGEAQRFHHLLDLCNKYVKPWSHLTFLVNVLEAEGVPEVSASTILSALRSFDVVEQEIKRIDMLGAEGAKGDTGGGLPMSSLVDSSLRENPCTPSMIHPGGNIVNLGAKLVFEGIATNHESKESVVNSLKGGHRIDYWSLWMLTVWRMGMDKVTSEKTYKELLNTFYALCDLALFVPAGGLYGHLRRPSMTWYDVHPGGRFLTALGEATKLGWIEDLEKEMLPYQERLCELLGWPSPKEFLTLGANLSRSSDRHRRHADACQVRLDSYSALIVLGREFDEQPADTSGKNSPGPVSQFFAAHRPMMYTPSLGHLKLRTGSDSGSEELSQVLDWFFSQFNYQVTAGGSVVYEEMLPADVRYDSYWSNIKSREDLIATVRAAVPLLSPDRFRCFQG